MVDPNKATTKGAVLLALLLGSMGGYFLANFAHHDKTGCPLPGDIIKGGEETFLLSVDDGNSADLMLDSGHPGEEGQRRQLGWNPKKELKKLKDKAKDLESSRNWWRKEADKYKNAASSASSDLASKTNQVNSLTSQLSSKTSQLASKTSQLASKTSQVSSLTSQLASKTSQLASKTSQLASKTSQLASKASQVTDLEGQINDYIDEVDSLTNKLDSLPNKLKNAIVKPIKRKVDDAREDLESLDDIANNLAEETVNKLKDMDWLPKSGSDLAKYLGDALENTFKEFCLPYNCIADKLGLDISGIELYKTDNIEITTALIPKTCLGVTKATFDATKLGNFLELFKNLDVLEDIFNEVKNDLVAEMKKVTGFSKDAKNLLKGIRMIANNAADELGLRRRQLVIVENGEEQVGTMEDLATMAHEKGMARFQELYGEHITKVFHERKLAVNAADYIAFDSLVLEFTADFGQSFSLEAEGRTGYAGSVFDESMHQTSIIPLPVPMMNLIVSGSMAGSMPYAMAMEGSARADFGYNVGEMAVSLDMISLQVTDNKQPFTTDLNVTAEAGISATMSLDFASSQSLSLCLGPTEDACITVTIDASQSSAAGFDALAALNGGNLTTYYTDVLEYEEAPMCGEQLSISAGYWQYVKSPAVKVGITGPKCCMDKSDTLFKLEAKVLQHSIDHFCLSTDVF